MSIARFADAAAYVGVLEAAHL